MSPDVGSISRSMHRPVVLLPLPDSPTRPNVSPSSIDKAQSSTALTTVLVRKEAAAAREVLGEVADFDQRRATRLGPVNDRLRRPRGFGCRVLGPILGSLRRNGDNTGCDVAVRSRRAPAPLSCTPPSGTGSAARTCSPEEAPPDSEPCLRWREAAAGLAAGNRCQQPLRVGMQRVAEDVANRAFFDDPAGIHHRDTIRCFGNDAEIVRDQEQRQIELLSSCRAAAPESAPAR